MADVFVSYHEKSAGEIVKQIAAALENVGVSCWYAQRNLTDFGAYAATIARAIRDCKVFLLVLNEESTQSEHVKNEIGLAFHRISKHEKMALALFRLDNCTLPDDLRYYLNRFQITNGNPPDAQKIQQLSEQIQKALREQPFTPPAPDSATQTQQSNENNNSGKLFHKIIVSVLSVGTGIILVCLLIFVLGRRKPPSWELRDGVLMIHDTYDMQNYDPFSNPPPWYPNRRDITSASLSDGVAFIGNYMFYDCVNLKSVSIGKNIASIGNASFRHCTSLENIQLSPGLSYIGWEAFSLCSRLSELAIPDSVNIIVANAFQGCTNLEKVRMPDNLSVIESGTFSGCESLGRIDIPNSVTAIGYQAFDGCTQLTSVTISQNATELEYRTFGNCQSLPSVIIPDSMRCMHESAFSGCKSLASASVPAGLNIEGVFPETTAISRRPPTTS